MADPSNFDASQEAQDRKRQMLRTAFGPIRENRNARSSSSMDIAAATPGAGEGAPRFPSPTTK